MSKDECFKKYFRFRISAYFMKFVFDIDTNTSVFNLTKDFNDLNGTV